MHSSVPSNRSSCPEGCARRRRAACTGYESRDGARESCNRRSRPVPRFGHLAGVGVGGRQLERRWDSFDDGLEASAKDGKPICLVIYTSWCPHCKNYAAVFHDPGIEKLAKQFVMVRIDQSNNESLSRKYAPDGAYIPRTLFLAAGGEMHPEIKIPREKYVHFYDEHDPAQLRDAMKNAHDQLSKRHEDS